MTLSFCHVTLRDLWRTVTRIIQVLAWKSYFFSFHALGDRSLPKKYHPDACLKQAIITFQGLTDHADRVNHWGLAERYLISNALSKNSSFKDARITLLANRSNSFWPLERYTCMLRVKTSFFFINIQTRKTAAGFNNWASAWDFQQSGMCDQQSLRSACAYAQSDQNLCLSLEYSMIIKLLTEHHLEFLSLKGGCGDSSESTHVKMPHCWKTHALAHIKKQLSAPAYSAPLSVW